MLIAINRILGALFFGGGLWASGISAYYVFQDWATLNAFYARFESLVAANAPLRSLYIVGTEQAAFRLNLLRRWRRRVAGRDCGRVGLADPNARVGRAR